MSEKTAYHTQFTDDLNKIERTTGEKYTKISVQFTPKGVAWALKSDNHWYFVGRDYHPISEGYKEIIGINEGIALVQATGTSIQDSQYQYVVVYEEKKEDGLTLAVRDHISEMYDYATLFRHGFATVQKNGCRYHISLAGIPLYDPKKYRFVWPFEFSSKFNMLVAEVLTQSGRKKYINREGIELEGNNF